MSATKKRPFGCLLIIIGIIILSIAEVIALKKHYVPIISPIPKNPRVTQWSVPNIFAKKKDPSILKQQIQDTVAGYWDNYSVYVVDYSSDFSMGINEELIYDAASVNKIPILAALYDSVEKRQVDMNSTITMQQKDIQDYGTGSMRYDAPGTVYSVKTMAQLMTKKSDNTAAYILANYTLKLSDIQNKVTAWGMSQTDMIENTTSNRDIAILMKKIYDGKIAGPALTQEMLGLLKDSDFENRLPALLPKDVVVYHKIGTTDGGIHDTGIVTRGNTTYYIGIFTADAGLVEPAETLIAKISRVAFDFMD